MRIVYYVVGWPHDRFPNGIVTATASLAPALRSAGHDVRILAHYGDGNADPMVSCVDAKTAGPAILRAIASRFTSQPQQFMWPAKDIASRINKDPALAAADIVEMEESFGWSRIVAARIGPPVITRLHGPWFINGAAAKGETELSEFDRKRIRLEKEAIAASAAISAPSQFVLDAVRNYYGLSLDGGVVIPNAVATVSDEWRIERAVSDEILFVGRFDRHKGADTALLAFAELARARPRARLVFAGRNNTTLRVGDRVVSCAEFLRANISPDIAQRITFLGPVPFSDLGSLRKRAFVTIVCSRVEIFAGVVLEALAHGSPTVATAVGGTPEILRDGIDGILVPPEDPGALATAICTILDNPDLAARLGRAGYNRVRAAYSPQHVSGLTLDYYRALKSDGRERSKMSGT